MASLGLTPFKAAIALEIAANIASLPSLLLNPDYALSFLVSGSSQITPATRTLAQWFGALIAGLAVPLAISYPTPAAGPAGEAQRGFRRGTYTSLGCVELAFAIVMGSAYLRGTDTGMTNKALVGGALNMAGFAAVRAVFLFWKPHLLEERGEGKKRA